MSKEPAEEPRTPGRILFSVGGVGLGNATRCEAIVAALEGHDVRLQGFGNSRRHFARSGQRIDPLVPMLAPPHPVGEVLAIPLNLVCFVLNSLLTFGRILRRRPDVVVVDSEYSAIVPALLLGCRLVSINHAIVARRQWEDHGSPELSWTYFSREVPDSWLARLAHTVLVPTFDAELSLPEHHVAVPPILRTLPEPVSDKSGTLILRGGSSHCSPVRLDRDETVTEIGAQAAVGDSLSQIAAAEVVVCQGGMSSLSEVLALGCRAIVVPLPGHAEQVLNARMLSQQGRVILAEDGDVSRVLESARALQPQPEMNASAGANRAAEVLDAAVSESRRKGYVVPALPPWFPRLRLAFVLTVVAAVLTDVGMHFGQLIKMETANVFQLEAHALVRDGFVVLASQANYYADGIHHLFFHPLLLLSPALGHAAIVLNVVHFLGVFALMWVVGRRLGRPAGLIAAMLWMAAPVSPILSKHVISTGLMPLTAVAFLGAFLDFSAEGRRRDLGRCLCWFAALFALNNGHLLIAAPLIYTMWRHSMWRPPLWSIAVAIVLSGSGIIRRVHHWSETGRFMDIPDAPIGTFAVSLSHYLQRLIMVEWQLHRMFVNQKLIFVFAALLCWWAVAYKHKLPRGMLPLLLTAPAFAFVNNEALVVWQIFFAAGVAWAASHRLGLAKLCCVHAVLGTTVMGVAFNLVGPPEDDFFTLSTVRTRTRVLDVLTNEMNMKRGEFETMLVSHPEGEGDINALLPGLTYEVDRVREPLPEGGDRCLSLTNADEPPPEGVVLEDEIVRWGLAFRSWRQAEPCTGSPRIEAPTFLVLDLDTMSVVEHTPGRVSL